MNADAIVTFTLIVLCCLLVWIGGSWMERRWNRMHPPDDWYDGCREDKDHDKDTR